MPTDLELLTIEVETQWSVDARGRLRVTRDRDAKPAPYIVIATSGIEQRAWIDGGVSDATAAELDVAIEESSLTDPAVPPVALAVCEQILADALGPVEIGSGPSYVVARGTTFASSVPITRSDTASPDDVARLRAAHTERTGWPVDEWQVLLDGALGPWAIAMIGERIISVCHSARLMSRGAEAGVWTDPEFRGRGHAAAVTAAWTEICGRGGRTLFYSTSASNMSSQRVAARLGLRPIGWLWQLSPRALSGSERSD